MKNFLAVFLVFSGSLLAQAQGGTASTKGGAVSPSSDWHVQLGGNYTWAKIAPGGLTATSGNLGGIQALFEYWSPRMLYSGLQAAWRQGNTTEGGNARSLCYIDVQGRLGYGLNLCDNGWDSALFTGFGYRHYGEKVTPPGSVTYEYNHFYVPVGALLDGKINSMVAIGVDFEWMPQVYPTVKIVPLKGARWILKAKLSNFHIGLPLTIGDLDQNGWFGRIEPFFEYWQDGESTAVAPDGLALGLPHNTYYFAGVNVNFGYSF